MVGFYLVLGIIVWVVVALWPANLAKRKGYSFILFFLLSMFISWVATLIIVLILKNKNITDEDREADRLAEAELDREENS